MRIKESHFDNKIKLSAMDFYILLKTINHNMHKNEQLVIKTHKKKLEALTEVTSLPFTADEIIKNISSYTPTDMETDILFHPKKLIKRTFWLPSI